jgi:hypothetical protein
MGNFSGKRQPVSVCYRQRFKLLYKHPYLVDQS